MTRQIGTRVPDLDFLLPDGRPVSLAAFPTRPLLLVFLRHLA